MKKFAANTVAAIALAGALPAAGFWDGQPAYDRILGSRFGSAAVHALADGDFGKMVALRTPNICRVPLAEATAQLKTIPTNDDLLVAARGLGICFGDDLRAPRALAV